ncbi:hypothetical protein [Bradyrhizobium sp. Rc3b]|uniref:hypothetical protein n=1 Tax=Bradyrhizobium sp. Rc3b TaxID=1855322 RepID=UPI0011604B76|nr:hypothetical protein [Bradyrhizobium sp. Rc3b]
MGQEDFPPTKVFDMTDYRDIRPAAGQTAGAAIQFNLCRTAVNTSRRRLELIQIDSIENRGLFRSANPNLSVGEPIMSRQDRFNGAPADKSPATTGATETTPPGQYCAEPTRGGNAISCELFKRLPEFVSQQR